MGLPDQTVVSRLTGLLKHCTALVLVDGKSRGTAFFVSENQLLTCEHVVKGYDEVEVQPHLRAARKARVVARKPETELDLALLEVTPDEKEEPLPCVLLDNRLDEADYYLAGYPREEGQQTGLEVLKLRGHPRVDNATGLLQQLQLEAGGFVTWGLSGGPVLNTAAGAVTAVVRSARDPTDALGGGAIPISKAAEAFEQVKQVLAEPPLAIRRWRNALGKETWQQLGRPWGMRARVDLIVKGARHKWSITTDPTGAPAVDITGRDLGDDVTEAMFRWAQRRRISATEEVELLGRLLARALFPSGVAANLKILANADEVLVRLHVAPETKLADIPWELAAIPGQAGRFLAADPRFRFVRIDDTASVAPPPEEVAPIRVLAVVGLPQRWIFPKIYREQTYPWPKNKDIWAKLKENLAGTRFRLTPLEDPEPSDLLKTLESTTFDVLHYVGVGRIGRHGQAQLSMVDSSEGDGTWQEANDVLKSAGASGVRLVVLEFTMPPADQVVEPVAPSALSDVLQGSISAVVYTRFPVHPRQFQSFNREFYLHLGDGGSVETAVQLGRDVLERNKFVEDAAGFGWFSLVTGPRSDIRLVQPRTSSPREPTPHRPLENQLGDRDEETSRPPAVSDAFSR
jgi:Trypsin-like peptidase domain/CHAT domain